jgi:hypothetical protein
LAPKIQTIDFYLEAARELRNQLVEQIAEEWGEPKRICLALKDYQSIREHAVCDQITSIATTFLSTQYP